MPNAIRNSEQQEWLPRLGVGPQAHAETTAILAAIRRVIDTGLTAYEQRVFVAIVVGGIPLDAFAARLGVRRLRCPAGRSVGPGRPTSATRPGGSRARTAAGATVTG
jgi:hypothetical protein